MDLQGARVVVANWRDPDHSMAGGAERYAWELARGLHEAGARVDFLTAREPGRRRTEHRDGIRIVRRGGRFGYYPRAAAYLLRHRGRIDAVVDCESGIPVFSPLFVRRSTPVLLVVHHVHLDQFATYFPAPLARLGQLLEGRLMPRVYAGATTVAVSASTRDEMRSRLRWTRAIGLLRNGNTAPPDGSRGAAPAADPADSVDRLVVLGRLAEHKRVDLVVRAVAALRTLRPAIRLDVIGTGPQLEPLRRLVADLGVEKHVTVHGFVDEETKHRLLAGARLHVCASDAEGWGQVVVEAAGHGVPTVARDVPGLRESVRHEHTGWLLEEPAADLAAVQARLLVGIGSVLDALEDAEHREEVATACRAWAARFSWPVMRREAADLVARSLGATASGRATTAPSRPSRLSTPSTPSTPHHPPGGPHPVHRTEPERGRHER
jgi:glycosyltransferase involved in cell wall biosynthesis